MRVEGIRFRDRNERKKIIDVMPDDATFTATVAQQLLWSSPTYVNIRTWSNCKHSIVRMASVLISFARVFDDVESTKDRLRAKLFNPAIIYNFALESLYGKIAFLDSQMRLNNFTEWIRMESESIWRENRKHRCARHKPKSTQWTRTYLYLLW